MPINKRIIIIFIFSFWCGSIIAEGAANIEDTVEPDIFFGEAPDGEMDFIDELPSNGTSPDQIYSIKKPKGRVSRPSNDVIDKGPIELKQAPTSPPRDKYAIPKGIEDDPLFSIEKESPIQPQQPTTPSKQQAQEFKGNDFEFSEAPGENTPMTPGQQKAQGIRPNQRSGQPSKELDEDLVFPGVGAGTVTSRAYNPSSSEDVEVHWNHNATQEIKIKHPNAEKGLIRIKQDRTYVYVTPKSKQDRAFSFRFGMYNPENLANPDTGTTFQTSYSAEDAPIVFFDYEWHWLNGSLGKFGFKLGTGIFSAEGNGSFKTIYAENGGRNTPLEKFTFLALPNSAGLVYRMQFYDDQILIPYADGGVMGITFFEFRDDKDLPRAGLGTAGFFSVGGMFNLGRLDKLSVLELDREYGINSIFLTGEFRQIVNLGSDFDFEATAINGGILMDF
ncbi:MAG: hypothetical protein KDD34_03185 [Bdellovibrionales bacterium]|nr:hypothetical protein [Bdellovibrionales bacterium]